MDKLQRIQRKATQLLKGPVNMTGKRRLRKDLISISRGVAKKDDNQLLCASISDRTESNGFKWQKKKFKLDIRKNFLIGQLSNGTSYLERFSNICHFKVLSAG